ncbi:hypothetical protein AB1N83_008422 [Pleurotus pulmonarius]
MADTPSESEAFKVEIANLLVAFLLTAMLYGVSLFLIGLYFLSPARPKDTAFVKCTVGSLGVLATIEIVFLSIVTYYKTVDSSLPIGVFSAIPMGGIIFSVSLMAFIAQFYFASRIWIVSSSRWLYVGPITFLAFTQFVTVNLNEGAASAQAILEDHVAYLDLFDSSLPRVAVLTAATAAADILSTIGLCRTLQHSRSGISRTDAVIAKIIRYSIQRGAATSLAAVLTLIMFVTVAQSAFMIPLLVSGQLYVISVVSMLLNRSKLQDLLHGDHPHHSPALTLPSGATTS